MKYKVITFLLLIPLILMICVFSAAKVVSLQVPIAVTGISITNSNLEVIDLADFKLFKINANISPTNASNKEIYYSTERVEGEKFASIRISEDGTVTPLTVGYVKIKVTTADGAYSDSFILNITSKTVTEIEIDDLTSTNLEVGDNITLTAKAYPETAEDTNIVWTSSNSNIIEINQSTGFAKAKSSGDAIITASITAGSNIVMDTITLHVDSKITDSLITVDGKEENAELSTTTNEVGFVLEVNATTLNQFGTNFTGFEDLIWQFETSEIDSVELVNQVVNNNIYTMNVRVNINSTFSGNASLKVRVDSLNTFNEFVVKKISDLGNVDIELNSFKECVKVNTSNIALIDTMPSDAINNFEISCETSSSNLVAQYKNGRLVYKANEVGQYTLKIIVKSENVTIKEFNKTVNVLSPLTSLNFLDLTKTFGIENVLTIANKSLVNNEYVDFSYKLEFAESDIDYSKVVFETSDSSIATVDANGYLHISDEGLVTISAYSRDAQLLGYNISTSLTVRCVDGVNVSNYEQIRKSAKDNKQIVLLNSVDLGEKLIKTDSNGVTTLLKSKEECASILKSEVEKMPTTYEWNYYKNAKGYETAPEIYYCIKFTNNVFGNGYSINANNITNMVDGNGNLYDFALFRGPLDFLSISGASVKGQDNIAFVVDDNVTLNNVELIGANISGNNSTDLSKLNYVGTTVEVIGDNVNIINSRIKNGRNVLRVYGDELDAMKKINVRVESCILSYAREFLVKLGTNAVQKGDFVNSDNYNLANGLSNDSEIWEQCAPTIENLKYFNKLGMTEIEYRNLVNEYLNDQTFNSLVKSELTLKNTILNTSGLFSVGIECCFAGPALDGGKWNGWDFESYGWVDIVGTSYPTRLNIEGDFKIYDWKNIANIDSSTLIDGSVDFLKFDLKEMVKNIASYQEFAGLITTTNGNDYAHGGIAMFGGGKNYCLIDTTNSTMEELPTYSVSFDKLKSTSTHMDKLKMAAGKEEFRFLMYNDESEFNLEQQEFELSQDISKYIGKILYEELN